MSVTRTQVVDKLLAHVRSENTNLKSMQKVLDLAKSSMLLPSVCLGLKKVYSLPNVEGSPLLMAVLKGKTEIIKCFESYGASINTVLSAPVAEGKTSVHIVADSGNIELMKKVIDYQPNFEMKDDKNRTPYDIALGKMDNPMMNAIKEGMQTLNMYDNASGTQDEVDGQSQPLYLTSGLPESAVNKTKPDLSAQSEPWYLSCKVEEQSVYRDDEPFVTAKPGDIFEAIRALKKSPTLESVVHHLNKEANENICESHTGFHPFHLSILASPNNIVVPLVETFIAKGYDVNKPDKYGRTVLWYASVNKGKTQDIATMCRVVEVLLTNGAECNVCDKEYITPLYNAVSYNLCKIAELLCQYGANINFRSANGDTPMEIADKMDDSTLKRVLQTTKVMTTTGRGFISHINRIEQLIDAVKGKVEQTSPIQQDLARIQCLVQQTRTFIPDRFDSDSDDLSVIIEITCKMVGKDWKDIFRHLYPDQSTVEAEIDNLVVRHSTSLSEQARQALLLWRNKDCQEPGDRINSLLRKLKQDYRSIYDKVVTHKATLAI